jgi:serine/threonine-protein kinase HipA
MKGICGICYTPLEAGEQLFHRSCSKDLFGTPEPPALPYSIKDIEALAENVVRASITVPGVQTKLSLHLEKEGRERGRLTIVGMWGAFILKPPVPEYPFMPEIEDMTMHLASIAGIEVVPHGLMPMEDGSLAYITRRVDRPWITRKGKRYIHKRHMEDMCQLSEKMTENKYVGSMEQISKLIRRYSSNPGYDLTRFFDMTLFSFLVGNADMHLKNFSLLYKEDESLALAPAYDQISTRLLIPKSVDPDEMALTVNGKKARLKRTDFEQFGRTSGMNDKQISNAFERMRRKIPDMVDFLEKGFLPQKKIEEFRALVLERASRVGI